ncbi:MAG: cytochrome c biogenesis protein CcsA [Sphingobacteriales bacterium]|nr:cytochrome c biogenesis protein CcsA [Sphingobacteriales bacterium]
MDENIVYAGERLIWGNAGHFFTLLSLFAALLAAVSYIYSFRSSQSSEQESWKKLARRSFAIHALAVFGIVVVLFLMIFNHYFEYQYVWQHSSRDLPFKYMLSCFWEGQEGSFLLWSFWHVILAGVVIAAAGKWETPVMISVSVMQVFLATMLIGIYVFGYKIGSSPFILMREQSPLMPLFMNPDYVSLIKDGNGLNPLLQNYWMVIHPPVLFLGFAGTLFPFAYGLAAVWRRTFDQSFVLPTLRWSLLAYGVLGVGILMGGAWAYESLSFGGYWAWDPVENASLVPWIFGIAGIHTLLAYKYSGHALRITYIFLFGGFWLVLYSTFLTRSGVLGDTSVHAFTDLGMSGQLLVFMLSFILFSAFYLIKDWKKIPSPPEEEQTYSREFWMFVGTLLMVLLATLVAIDTSWPVINKIFGTERVIIDPVSHYNRYSIWFAVGIGLLAAMTQYLRYKKASMTLVLRKLAVSVAISALITAIVMYFARFEVYSWYKIFNSVEIPFIAAPLLLLFSSVFAIVANLYYLLAVLNGKLKIAGASIAHVGFGLMLLGVLLSSGLKEVLSINNTVDFQDVKDEQFKRENILLPKNVAVQMGGYWVTYQRDSINRPDTYYEILYEKKKNMEDAAEETFKLYPYAQVNPKMGLLSNPSTKHYLTKDIFTHISSIPQPDETENGELLSEAELAVGDTLVTTNALIILQKINASPTHEQYLPLPNDIAASAILEVRTPEKTYQSEPLYFIRNNTENRLETQIEPLGLTLRFERIFPEKGKVLIKAVTRTKPQEYIIMKAIQFPHINLLWLGCIVMAIGFMMSLWQRYAESKRQRTAPLRQSPQWAARDKENNM